MNPENWKKEWAHIVNQEVEIGAARESAEANMVPSRTDPTLTIERAQGVLTAEPPFIPKYKTTLHKAQWIALGIGLMAAVFTPLISDVHYRVAVLAFDMGLLLKLFIVFYDELKKKFDSLAQLIATLITILTSSRTGKALRLANFGACQPLIEAEGQRILKSGQELTFDLQVVAAFFSWPFFRYRLLEWCREFPQRTIKFRVGFVCPDLLRQWNAEEWAQRVNATLAELQSFNVTPHYSNLRIEVYLYDHIPETHGILINGKTLLKGRTEWVHSKKGAAVLEVGSRPYMRFSADDPEGNDEVSTFRSWIERNRQRSIEVAPKETKAEARPENAPRRSQRAPKRTPPIAPPFPQGT